MSNEVPAPDPLAVWLGEREQEIRASRPHLVEEEEEMPPTEKTCTRCGKEKPFSAFNKGPSKEGLQSWCKQCQSEASKQRRAQQQVNTEKPRKKQTNQKPSPAPKPAREPEPQEVPDESQSGTSVTDPPLPAWANLLRGAALDPTLSQLEALATFLECDLWAAINLCKEVAAGD